MKVYRHLNQIVTLTGARKKDGRKLVHEDLGIISDGAIAFDESKILWVGPDADLPGEYSSAASFDLTGHVLTPGLVDSHTHLVFAGDRAEEYLERLNGVDYQIIAKRGGGILYTVQQTVRLSEDELFALSCPRLERMISYGICAIEIKSGYALSIDGELKQLRVIKRLKSAFQSRLRIIATFMGAHAVPSSFASSADYLEQIVIPTLKKAHTEGLVDAVDVFHEAGYFSTSDVEKLFTVSKQLGLTCKLHADEFQNNDGAKLAAQHKAVSADHLLMVSDDGVNHLAKSSTVATLLPGTAFFLGKPLAPARKMLDQGCKVAIASDYNPGSSHIDNVLMVASIAAPSLKMNSAEVWCAITLNAAHALGLEHWGSLEAHKAPKFTLFKAQNLAQITYNWGLNLSSPLP